VVSHEHEPPKEGDDKMQGMLLSAFQRNADIQAVKEMVRKQHEQQHQQYPEGGPHHGMQSSALAVRDQGEPLAVDAGKLPQILNTLVEVGQALFILRVYGVLKGRRPACEVPQSLPPLPARIPAES